MPSSFENDLLDKLARHERKGLTRTLSTVPATHIDFSSNDYLGLAKSGELRKIVHAEARNSSLGSTGSRLLTGNSAEVAETERFLAGVFGSESGLLFNSGYAANLGLLSSLPGKGDTILYDERSHASIKDGARLSLARRFSFAHNDADDLREKLGKVAGRAYVVVESVYSMDGDVCPLREIAAVAKRHAACLIVDEAHSTGLYDGDGGGYVLSQGLQNDVDIRVFTFGKAIGLHGAFVASSTAVRNFLINFSRPFIYTTAMAPDNAVAICCAFRYIADHPTLQTKLRKNIERYGLLSSQTGRAANKSAIQTLMVGNVERARAIANGLQQKGFDVRPILSPTVPAGSERLRICLHSFNTENEINALYGALNEIAGL